MTALEEQLAELQSLASPALHARWIDLTNSAVPRVSPKILRLALAWELQARAANGISGKTTRMIDHLARASPATSPFAPLRLTREWRGRVHVVTVDKHKVVHWNGREWRSLSEVAREITGTRWSGPAFFGLKKKAAA
ncbi:DUF2924 domain-containing protein [Sphingomonas mucosissima]|uniref:DUF2924 domain-containing protein n=1 Tax=Sphingomonas mucosissima TaxID=370959 RepID=A0A245ZDE8_9SPHN|nr:DUF2924 domain-containing protein [Sphingomonas mucosissima]OWK27707.1 hypothetical protein SPMU_33490 [Sphingomonas mucosissima]